jgi:hypothetical protein
MMDDVSKRPAERGLATDENIGLVIGKANLNNDESTGNYRI